MGKSQGKERQFYYAYSDRSGRRVKKGTRGAKRIRVRINREALQRVAQRTARIHGKFAERGKAKRKLAAMKAVATRHARQVGAEFTGQHVFKTSHYVYRYYTLADYSPEIITAAIDRELLNYPKGGMQIVIKYTDSDDNEHVISTPLFRATADNAESLAEAADKLMGSYDVRTAEIDSIVLAFTPVHTVI